MKYPRTYHLPFSPGATTDDKQLEEGWFTAYKGREVVISEKLDGENTHMTRYDVYARSHGAPTRSPWSINLWGQDGLYWRVKDLIGENEEIFGENLFGEHSIHYDALTSYFYMFAVLDNNEMTWYSWDDVMLMADTLKVPTVPVLWRGSFDDEIELEAKVNKLMLEPSAFGKTKEGIVMRIANEFPSSQFSSSVCKWVRPNHVQTDEHWTHNWKKATLIQ